MKREGSEESSPCSSNWDMSIKAALQSVWQGRSKVAERSRDETGPDATGPGNHGGDSRPANKRSGRPLIRFKKGHNMRFL